MATLVPNTTISILKTLACAAASLAINEAVVLIIEHVSANASVDTADKHRRRVGIAALKAKRRKIVAGVASVLGARAVLRGKIREADPTMTADFAALRFAADMDTPLKTESLSLSTWGDEIRKLISAPRGITVRKILLQGNKESTFLWPKKTAIFIIDYYPATSDEAKLQRINERATTLVQQHSSTCGWCF